MQTTPTPGLLHQLSELLQQRAQAQPQPQVANEPTVSPRKMVTAQRTVHQPADQRGPVVPHRAEHGEDSESEPPRNVPRGTFLNIVV